MLEFLVPNRLINKTAVDKSTRKSKHTSWTHNISGKRETYNKKTPPEYIMLLVKINSGRTYSGSLFSFHV